MNAQVIAIATHKGGTGKTVSTMALGAALARSGQPVLIVDLDPQGHSTIGLGVEIPAGAATVRELFVEQPTPAARILRHTAVPGLDILPADIRLAPVANGLVTRRKREELLWRSLAPLRDRYAFVFVDCPPFLGPLVDAALTAADRVLIPCQYEARAADGLVDLLEVIHDLKGPDFADWHILLTKVDRRKTTTIEAVLVQLEPYKHRILGTQIPQSEPLNQAQIARTDIFDFDPKCSGALAYSALAAELFTTHEEQEAAATR